MSKRLLERQALAKKDAQKNIDLGNKPIHELWLQSDKKKRTSEVNKQPKEKNLPSVFESLMPTIPSSSANTATRQPALDLDMDMDPLILSPNPNPQPAPHVAEKIPSSVLDGLMPQLRTATTTPVAATTLHPYADVLILSPNMSSPASCRSPFEEAVGNLFAQLQIRRSRPEHSPSILSPNFSPSFSPRFVPQQSQFRPKTLMDYLQNFGQNTMSSNEQQQNKTRVQGDPKKTASIFFTRVFGNNRPTPPQLGITQNQGVEGAVSTDLLSQFQTQHQITNTLNNFPGGAVVMRTVQSGPDGSTITNTRVLSLDNLLDQDGGFGNLDARSPQLFGEILQTLSGMQGANMFKFSDTSAYITEERGYSQKSLQNAPSITYETQKFKEVETKKCGVCEEALESGHEVKDVFCVHKFHKQCIDEWPGEHFSCPTCKTDRVKSEEASK